MPRLLVAVLLLSTTGASAQVLPSGQEEVIGRMLAVDSCVFEGAAIEQDVIVADYDCDAPVQVRLYHPTRSRSPDRTEQFAIEGAPPALRDALVLSIRAHEEGVQWIDPSVASDDTSLRTRRFGTWALMLLAFVLSLVVVVRMRRRPVIQWRLVGALCLVGFAMAVIPEVGPLHDHLSFLGRADCARSPFCDDDRPGWMPPIYHALEPVLNVLPYRSSTLVGLTCVFSLLALVFAHGTLRRLMARWDPRGYAALVGTVVIGLNPLVLRMSLSHSWWALMMALVWGASWLCLVAMDEGGAHKWAAAAAALALAGATSVAAVPIVAVIGFSAVVASRKRRDMWPMLGAVGFVAAYAWPIYSSVASVGERFEPATLLGRVYFDYRFVPLALPVLAAAAGVWLARRRSVVGVALGVCIIVSMPFIDTTRSGYPFLSLLPVLHFSGALAAVAVVMAFRRSWRLGYLALAALLLSSGLSVEAWKLTRAPRPLADELAAIEASFDELPEHSRLVLPPESFDPLPGVDLDGDPIEARFPLGMYTTAMARRGLMHQTTIRLGDWLAQGAPTADTLVYLGSTLFTFQPSEIESNAPNERPLLSRVRERVVLEPVHTFEIATLNHPLVIMRIAADREPEVTLGFYRPAPNR